MRTLASINISLLPGLKDTDRIAGQHFCLFLPLRWGKNQHHRGIEDQGRKNQMHNCFGSHHRPWNWLQKHCQPTQRSHNPHFPVQTNTKRHPSMKLFITQNFLLTYSSFYDIHIRLFGLFLWSLFMNYQTWKSPILPETCTEKQNIGIEKYSKESTKLLAK